jgi:phenylpropionate dioxygenase-like ring-hydroxylating dioxygenase large terminal subunit
VPAVDRGGPGAVQTLRNTHPKLRHYWHPVALEADVPADRPLRVVLLGEPWAIVRLGGRLTALADRCPHRLVPLSAGRIVEHGNRAALECRYHGYRFDGCGRCVAIPALDPEVPIPPRAQVATAAVEVRFGLVWIAPNAPDAPRGPLLDDRHYLDPEFDTFVAGPFTTRAGASIITDNFLDVAHFPFLHRATFGADDDGRPVLSVSRDGSVLRQYTARRSAAPQVSGTVDMRYEYTVAAPFAVALTLTLEQAPVPTINVVWSFCRPEVDDRTTWWIVHAYNDLGHDPALIERARRFQAAVGEEDLSILELMDDPNVPLFLPAEVHTKADAGTVEYRRMLREIVGAATGHGPETGT